MTATTPQKANILLIGSGGVGTMAAYNLEIGGLASVTSVLRSSYTAVSSAGFTINSVDHGNIVGWKPTTLLNQIPIAGEETKPYDFIIVATKNCPDIHPTVAELIAPAITSSHTTILLLQNGLNIEIPLIIAFPTNAILSGVSLIGATETAPGVILHDDGDKLIVSPYQNSGTSPEMSITAAEKFVKLYSASGKVKCEYNENVGFVRWRKLVYNASYNGLCAITRMDTSAMRYAKFPIEELVRPVMLEICAIAKAAGHSLPEEVVENMINVDPADTWFKPSMQQDVEKGNFIEFETIVGEPLREAEKLRIAAPNLKVVYGLLKVLQLKIKVAKGLVVLGKGGIGG